MTDQNSDVRKAYLDEARRFVPTTEQVCDAYQEAVAPVAGPHLTLAEFDRWLAEHDAQVLRDAATALYADETAEHGSTKAVFHAIYAAWLLDRAGRIAAGGES